MKLKNKNKAIHNIHRKKHRDKIDIEDPYWVGTKPFKCRICGSDMYPYKQDKYGDIIHMCKNPNCINSRNLNKSLNVRLKKLTREMQMHSRYYTDYLGGYYGKNYNPIRKIKYWKPGTDPL